MTGFFSSRRTAVGDNTPAPTAPILLEGRRIGRQDSGRGLMPYAKTIPTEITEVDRHQHQEVDFPRESRVSPPSTSVNVNNNGQFYRPWREELALSFAKTIGNFFAWPFRLVGKLAEGILNAGIGIVKMMLLAVVAPTLIYTGLQMYQARAAGESSTAVAAEVGKQGIGLVGAVLGGIWDGIFGDDEPKDAAGSEKQPAK